jgi:hypothetical protein
MAMITASLLILSLLSSGERHPLALDGPLTAVLQHAIKQRGAIVLVRGFQPWTVQEGDLQRAATVSKTEAAELLRRLQLPSESSFDWQKACSHMRCRLVELKELEALKSEKTNSAPRKDTVIELGSVAIFLDRAVVYWSEERGPLDSRLVMSVIARKNGQWQITEDIQVLVS